MVKVNGSAALIVGLTLGFSQAIAVADLSSCWVVEKTIEASEKCVPTGIYLGNYSPDELVSMAPHDPQVVRLCGEGGRWVQQRVFAVFIEKLSDAQKECEDKGGLFGYLKPNFQMPVNENYCPPAVAQVTSDRLEQYRVNMEVTCPSVVTKCLLHCR